MIERLNWHGIFSQGQGYSGSSEHLAVALNKLVDVSVIQYGSYDNKTGRKLEKRRNLTEEGKKLLAKPYQMAEIGISYGFPTTFPLLSNKRKVGFTMFETDRIPNGSGAHGIGNDWAGKTGLASDLMNQMDLMLVPSKQNKLLFAESGVTVPIEVAHLGVNDEVYKLIDRPRKKMFRFLMMGTLTVRKNPGMVISAFMKAFSGRKDVRLVLKSQQGTLPSFMTFQNANIEIIDESSTTERMIEYYRDADCFVFPSRGEGFGLTPLEAMATGLPTIVSDNTGMSEYADPKFCYPLKTAEMIKATRFPDNWGDVGNYFEPSFDELVHYMIHVEKYREEAHNKGISASKWVKENWTYDHAARELLLILERYFT